MNQHLSIIILAAGKGTRMKSNKAKVLHEVFYAPMVEHVLKSTQTLSPERTVIVVGHQKEEVQKHLSGFDIVFAEQKEQLGTGHAVLAAEDSLKECSGTVMILCGDTPLVRPELLMNLLSQHKSSKASVTLLTTLLDDPSNYGRILSDSKGNITGIVEHKDADEEQLLINEVNAGIYCVDKDFLFTTLKQVGTNNSQGEVYLTDIVHLGVEKQLIVKKFVTADSIGVLGVNSRLELAKAEGELQRRHNEMLMASGVSIINPATVRISPDTTIHPDVVLEPNVFICENTTVGGGAIIEQGCVLKNCIIGEHTLIGANSCLSGVSIADHTVIEPLTRAS